MNCWKKYCKYVNKQLKNMLVFESIDSTHDSDSSTVNICGILKKKLRKIEMTPLHHQIVKFQNRICEIFKCL